MRTDKLHIPSSTYRLQLAPDFGFHDARRVIGYLERLGAGDLYVSPIMEARPESRHGYDVTDPTRVRLELGGEEAFDALASAASASGMGILLDIVPNHMAASPMNQRWMDILEDGVASPWAHWFDINWRSRGRPGALQTHLLLPILGKPYGSVLESGELSVSFGAGSFLVNYYDWRLPLSPRSWPRLLEPGLGVMAATLGSGHAAVEGLTRLIEMLASLPPWTATDPDARAARHRGEAGAKEELVRMASSLPEVANHIEQNLRALAGTPGQPESYDWLDGILSVQPYRLCFWKLATERVSYRRFFDIGHLVGVRVEDRRVFRETHEALIRLVREGKIHGLRIDHIDGLLDPRGYLRRLRRACGSRTYILVEKILGSDEDLPDSWPVQGTTGYELLNLMSGPFVDPGGLRRLSGSWAATAGAEASFAALIRRCKRMVLETLFGGELQSVISDLVLAAERDRHGRDLSPRQLGDALLEVSAALPVYRTYVQGNELSATDRSLVTRAVADARGNNPNVDRHAFDMVERLLCLSWPHSFTPAARRSWRRVVQRWQQLTGPAMAKGLEDTALYIDARLLALNEVGADREAIEAPPKPDAFHARVAERALRWPNGMVCSSSHDSKRSEDVRARLLVLSEISSEWEAAMRRWSGWHASLERKVAGRVVPDRLTARFIYQTLIGVWPVGESRFNGLRDRVLTYMRKASREAKVHTSWIAPNEEYENALLDFVSDLFDHTKAPGFHGDMAELMRKVSFFGALNSLAMTHLKLTMPGVPDVYQGNEIWRFDLADPDNRRTVDFAAMEAELLSLDQAECEDRNGLVSLLLDQWMDGRVKLYLISRLLRHRRSRKSFYRRADYSPLKCRGKRSDNVLAFCRKDRDVWALSAVPRLMTRLTDAGRFPLGERAWRETSLSLPAHAPESYYDVLTGREVRARRSRGGLGIPAATIFESFPTALLISSSNP